MPPGGNAQHAARTGEPGRRNPRCAARSSCRKPAQGGPKGDVRVAQHQGSAVSSTRQAVVGVPGERRRRWLGSVGVQGLGAAATLAVGLLIAAAQGPQAQGRYGLVRSTADLLLALGLFGLPQGVVHLLNHLRAAPRRVGRWMVRYSALLAVLAALLLGGLWLAGIDPLRPAPSIRAAAAGGDGAPAAPSSDGAALLLSMLALAVGVLGWVVHGLQRVFVLCRGSTPLFSWLTVVPSLSLLAAVALLASVDSRRYELAVAFSGLASAACGALALRPLRRDAGWRQGHEPAGSALLVPSLHALVQTASLALQPWLALQLLQQRLPPGSHALGWFVFAGYVYQAFALPASFVAPLLYARASRAAGSGDGWTAWASGGPIRAAGWASLGASLIAAALLPLAVPALFGPAYAGAAGACVAMALCGPALLVGRLHTALLLGEGRFASVTGLFALRAALVPLCMLALWRWTPLAAATAAAAGLALAESTASGLQAALRAMRDRQSRPTSPP